MPVGRLDLNTEGLLLLTTDGELKRTLELPATGVERSYRARVFGEVSQAQLEELIHGVEIEGIRYGAIDANLERRTGRNAWVEMRLREGKNCEVRRVLEYLGLQVSRLIRTAYGPFPLADLPPGAVDEVKQHDLVALRKALGSNLPLQGENRQPAALLRAAPTARPAAPGRRGEARHGPARAERKPDRPAAIGERRPARPSAANDRRPGAPERSERKPGRPNAAGDRRPGPGVTADRKPGRAAAGDRRPGPGATGDRRPGRPKAAGDRRPGSGFGNDRKPGRPNGPGGRKPDGGKPGRPTSPRGGRK